MSEKFRFLKFLVAVTRHMMWKGVAFVLLLAMSVSAPAALAATSQSGLSVELELSKTQVELGEPVALKVSISGSSDSAEPVVPDVDGLQITLQGRAQSVQIVNMEVKTSRIFTYVVTARRKGEFTIGPAEVTRKGQTIKSDTVRLVVAEPPRSQPTATTQQGGNVIVEASVTNANPYVGQQITLLFRFARKAGASIGNGSYELPSLYNFWSEGIESRREYAQRIRDSDYIVTEVAVPIFPITEGDIDIGAIALRYDELVDSSHSRFDSPLLNDPFARSFFDDDFFKIFRSGEVVKKTAYTAPIRIHVRPLPDEKRPNGFKGGVGNFTMTGRLSGNEVKVGESVTLTITLSGEGNIRDMSDPKLEVEGVKVYSDTPSINVKNYHDVIVGEKVYKLAIVPQREGEIDIPKISISYFNPATGRYEAAAAGPLTLKALPAEREVLTPPSATGPERVVGGQGRQDILPIHERVGPVASNRVTPWLAAVWPIAYSLPLLAYALCFVLVKRRERLRTDTAYRRYKFATRTAESYIKDAHAAMASKKWDEVFTKCSRAVTDYLADKLNVPASGLTPADVKAELSSRRVSEALLKETIEFLEACDYGRFASSRRGPKVAREYIERAQYLIDRFEEEEAIKQ